MTRLKASLERDVPLHSPDGRGSVSADNQGDIKNVNSPRKRRRLARLVSQDALTSENGCLDLSHRTQAASPSPGLETKDRPISFDVLSDPLITKMHLFAVRLEADLFPMRLILSRLMSHSNLNRKGLFNRPVDPVALCLPDYHLIVKRPMDLGTIKKRLHALSYRSRDNVADDIRLVFSNAMVYNPPHNIVHKCASELLQMFEDSYKELAPCITEAPPGRQDKDPQNAECPTGNAKTVSPQPSEMHTASEVPPDSSNGQIAPTERGLSEARAPGLVQPKRKSRLPPFVPHSCEACLGRKCFICKQGCLSHEPSLLVCSGNNCAGSKIRKGVQYFISTDGNRQFCQKCFAGLPPVLPNTSESNSYRYKQELLKRKNDEEIVEAWLDCKTCGVGVHSVCAMRSDYLGSSDGYSCATCRFAETEATKVPSNLAQSKNYGTHCTFLSGSDSPVPMSSLGIRSSEHSAETLPRCSLASFIESKVRERMKIVPNADKTVVVRVISNNQRHFEVPDVVRRHFRMESEKDFVVKPPQKVHFNQRAIMLFQKVDGLDVCIFCMYAQEYDGKDQYDGENAEHVSARHSRRVYIAYIDSVEHFRPRECRTQVYHEILVSYLAYAKARGYEKAQIWACPPSRGNNFVFWNHPASQRTPTQDRLDAWYHGAISRAVDCGIITDVKSLFESDFEESLDELEKEAVENREGRNAAHCGRMICPPLLEGDFWIEEAARVHQSNMNKYIKARAPTEVCVWNVSPLATDKLDPCPALQVATLLKDRVMTHPSSVHFRRPVNAAALKLVNYHKIIDRPMDLGTVYSRCVLGEYHTLRELVDDVNLMVSNAKKFNPVGHFVHKQAIEIHDLFFQELSRLTKLWANHSHDAGCSWEFFADQSLNLDVTMDVPLTQTEMPNPCAVIEDDRSSDGSRSLGSSLSMPCSPAPTGLSGNEVSVDGVTSKPHTKIVNATPKPRRGRRPSKPQRKLNLLSDGPDAVLHSMVGEDTWLLDKRNPNPPKPVPSNKKNPGKKRRNSVSAESMDAPQNKKRRQSWLGEEVGDSVRKMRTSFFSCSLSSKPDMSEEQKSKLKNFDSYVACLEMTDAPSTTSSPIADARYALLEFSQFRHLEFDTLRRAKYSTAVLLFHMHNVNAPGVVPVCTTCNLDINGVRWHKVKKIPERRRVTKGTGPKKSKAQADVTFVAEELCGVCFEDHPKQEEFIPIPVSLKRYSSI